MNIKKYKFSLQYYFSPLYQTHHKRNNNLSNLLHKGHSLKKEEHASSKPIRHDAKVAATT